MTNDCGNRFRNIGIEALVKKAKGEDVPDYIAAHDCCTSNEIALQKSKTCACFYCERVFTPDQIEEWIDDRRGQKGARLAGGEILRFRGARDWLAPAPPTAESSFLPQPKSPMASAVAPSVMNALLVIPCACMSFLLG